MAPNFCFFFGVNIAIAIVIVIDKIEAISTEHHQTSQNITYMSGILSASPASHSRFLPLISEKDWPVKYSQLSQLGSGKISSIAKSILWQQLYNVTLARARA